MMNVQCRLRFIMNLQGWAIMYQNAGKVLVRRFVYAVVVGFLAAQFGCRQKANELPQYFLWAWERPEDLNFLAGTGFGVAFLAQTVALEGDAARRRPRLQPLKVPPQTYLMAVTRIAASRENTPALSAAQLEECAALVVATTQLPNVRAVQIDFDVAVSQRDFYRQLLTRVRALLPAAYPLSMTALASWCLGDTWLEGLPVFEAVPMAFRLGADNENVRRYLAGGTDYRAPLCQHSYGLALDEPLKAKFRPQRRFYFFNTRAWQAEDVPVEIGRAHV